MDTKGIKWATVCTGPIEEHRLPPGCGVPAFKNNTRYCRLQSIRLLKSFGSWERRTTQELCILWWHKLVTHPLIALCFIIFRCTVQQENENTKQHSTNYSSASIKSSNLMQASMEQPLESRRSGSICPSCRSCEGRTSKQSGLPCSAGPQCRQSACCNSPSRTHGKPPGFTSIRKGRQQNRTLYELRKQNVGDRPHVNAYSHMQTIWALFQCL